MRKRCWEPEWVREDKPIGEGNQGHTFLARRSTDLPGQFNYVLKKLKRQDDPFRRKRMHIEAESLRTIGEHPGVAALAATNAGQCDEDVELFIVTERIIGPDLEKYRSTAPGLRTAVEITSGLLETLRHCHAIPVLHRDIKPCHVILRDGDVQSPVLIDFGLAFNEEVHDEQFDTSTHHGVGNRFLLLTEQIGGNKRDPRSDIAQCVGVLFYLLTGQIPCQLNDFRGRKPHHAHDLRKFLSDLPAWQFDQLQRIFEIGFEWDPNKRWQSVDSLITELHTLLSDRPEEPDALPFAERVKRMKERVLKSPENELLLRRQTLHQSANQAFGEALRALSQDFHQVLTVGKLAANHIAGGDVLKLGYIISHSIDRGRSVRRALLGVVKSAEFVLYWMSVADFHQPPTTERHEVFRIGLFDPDAPTRLSEAVQQKMLDDAEAFLSDPSAGVRSKPTFF